MNGKEKKKTRMRVMIRPKLKNLKSDSKHVQTVSDLKAGELKV